MTPAKKDNRPLLVRLAVFQAERAPLIPMIIMNLLSVGVFANFTQLSWRNYLVAVAISTLYLIQTRTSDEKKDFEHDNKYHKDRPVQRGVVSLGELYVINQIVIIGQLALYASFLDWRIFLLGLASQGYAYLTRKEFFVREWIRQHFFTYYFFHYIQLVILNIALLNIVRPVGVAYWQLVTFIMLNIISVEVGRKMFAKKDDTSDDTFSAQLGHKGSAATLTVNAALIWLMVFWFISGHAQNYVYLVIPFIALGYIVISAYNYARKPTRPNAKHVTYAGVVMQLASMVGVILGA